MTGPRKRLLFITPKFGRESGGGLGVSAERITEHLSSEYTLDVLTAAEPLPHPHEKREASPSIRLTRLPSHRDTKVQLQAIHDWVSLQVRSGDVAAVLGFYAGPWSYAAWLAARRANLPFATFTRGNDIDLDVFGDGAFQIHALLSGAQRVFCVTSELESKVRAFAPASQSQFIPNGIDVSRYPLLPPRGNSDRPVIGIFGDIKQKKGLSFLLENLDWDVCQLRIVGNVREESAKILHGFLSVHVDLQPWLIQVPYVGSVAELIREYAACDVICIPSTHEGMANVMLEAMACGKTVLASRVGGAIDVVESGRSGFLFDFAGRDGSFQETLAAALCASALAGNPVGNAARTTVSTRFNPELERTRYLNALHELMEYPSPPGVHTGGKVSGYNPSTSRSPELG